VTTLLIVEIPDRRAPVIANRDIERAVAALQGALPHVSGPAEQRLTAAIDGIDGIIRTIRDVVFELGQGTPPETTSGSGDSPSRPAEANCSGFR
jgi:hypothetical protein